MYYKKIEGERIYLSPMNEKDYDLLTKWWNTPNIMKNYGGYGENFNEITQRDFIEASNKKGAHSYIIILKESGKPIGKLGFYQSNSVSKRYSYDLLIGEEAELNKGYGTEVTKLVIKYLFEILNAHSIESLVYEFNERSKKHLEKVGFSLTGKQREAHYFNSKYYDVLEYDILKSEYYNSKKQKSI